MPNSTKSRLLPLIGAIMVVGAVACVDSPTSPQVKGKRSLRDTTVIVGTDTVTCRNGYIIFNGRVVCTGEQ